VKKYRITGQIKKGKTLIPFSVEFRALKEEHAIQRLYSEMGSRHGARQFEITIKKIDETTASEETKA
jgi:large subunit ribosomal protein LX